MTILADTSKYVFTRLLGVSYECYVWVVVSQLDNYSKTINFTHTYYMNAEFTSYKVEESKIGDQVEWDWRGRSPRVVLVF